MGVETRDTNEFDTTSGASLLVVGDKALVILAAGQVNIEGTLLASADLVTPGAGGGFAGVRSSPNGSGPQEPTGPSSGGRGSNSSYDDGGGAGVGFCGGGGQATIRPAAPVEREWTQPSCSL